MGAAGNVKSLPQADGIFNGDDANDGSDSFCRLPSSFGPKSFRSPQKQSASSPSRRSCTKQNKAFRPSCSTSSTILTYESSPYSPYSFSNESETDLPGSPSSLDDSTEDCWLGPMLKNLISFISPQKPKCIIGPTTNDQEEAITNAVDHDVSCENDINSREILLDFSVTSESEQSRASPAGVEDFPTLTRVSISRSELPTSKRLFHGLQPEHPENPGICAQHIPFPNGRNLPNRRKHQHQHDPQDLKHLLHAASKYEAESDLDAAISSLEMYLHKSQQSLLAPSTSFAYEHSKATTLHKLGVLQWKCGRYFFSEHVLTDCIHLYQRLLLDESNPALRDPEVYSQLMLESAHVFVSTGRVYLSKGEWSAAMQCYNDCVRHLSSIPSSGCGVRSTDSARIFAQACVGAGRVLASQGKLKASLKRYRRALKVQLGYQLTDTPSLSVDNAKVPLNDVAETLSHLGRLYEQWDELTLAMECHAKALSIYQSVLDPFAVDIGYASNNIGHVYLRLGRVAEAVEALKLSHQVFSLRLGWNHRNTADSLLSLGQLYASLGQHKKALTKYKKVLRAEPAVLGQLLAVTLRSIACSYEAMMRLDKALKYFQRELNVTSPCHFQRAQLLHHMAKIAMQAVDSYGDYAMLDQAADWLDEAAEIYYNNEGQSFDHELLHHLEASIDETRMRMKRNRL